MSVRIHRLAQIRQLQYQGQTTEALAQCQKLAEQSADTEVLALLGVLCCQSQQFELGRTYLTRLPVYSLINDVEALTDIAGIHILLKAPALALPILAKALALSPEENLTLIRRGIAFMQTGQYANARADLASALTQCSPYHTGYLHINLARCALQLLDNDNALFHVEAAKALGSSTQEAWLIIAVETYIALDRWQAAETAINDAISAGVNPIVGIKLLALILAAQDKHDEAEHCLRQALQDYPEDIELLMQRAQLASVRGRFGLALHCINTALGIAPDNSALWVQAAHTAKRQFEQEAANSAADKALALTENKADLSRAEALTAKANLLTDTEQQQAEALFLQALAIAPDFTPTRLNLGHLYLQWGRLDDAVEQFEMVKQKAPVAGYGALINARRFPDQPETLARIEKMARIPSLQGSVSSSLLFDLAAAWEHQRDYAKAFQFAEEANQASRKFITYDAKQHRQYCLNLQQVFTRAFFQQRRHYGHAATLPVFVLGMPRSGTTLVEQILGGHPDIFVAGEIGIMAGVIQRLNAWEKHLGSGLTYPRCVLEMSPQQAQQFSQLVLDELSTYSPDARYIVDKLPHNFEHIGLIRLLFPEAPIIHVLREPRDVAVSNYFTDYQAKFGGMGFAYDLTDIGEQLIDCERLMQHWHQVVDKPILTVRYEDVVNNTEAQAKRILAYLDLPWTDAVLNYQNLERAVKTASIWQVRQPIYTTSTEKWKRYQAYLTPLIKVLERGLETDEAMVEYPATKPGLFFQGMAYLHQQQSALAEAVFKEILTVHPHHAAALHMLGVALYQQKKLRPALRYMQAATQRHPGHASWYNNLGLVLTALGKTQAATQAFNKAQALKSALSEHHSLAPKWPEPV